MYADSEFAISSTSMDYIRSECGQHPTFHQMVLLICELDPGALTHSKKERSLVAAPELPISLLGMIEMPILSLPMWLAVVVLLWFLRVLVFFFVRETKWSKFARQFVKLAANRRYCITTK